MLLIKIIFYFGFNSGTNSGIKFIFQISNQHYFFFLTDINFEYVHFLILYFFNFLRTRIIYFNEFLYSLITCLINAVIEMINTNILRL